MHPRFGKSTLQIFASALLGLALVAGAASSIFAQHATKAANAPQTIHGGVSSSIVRKGTVNLATLPVTHTSATARPAPRSTKTDRPLKTPAQLAAYEQYVKTHAGSLPKGTASIAPQATNLYGAGYMPIKQAAGVGLNSTDGGGWYPPDQAIAAVGPYTMEGVNNVIEVYNSSMAKTYGPWTPASFFASVYHAGDTFSDPQFAYDAENSVILIAWLEITSSGNDYLDIAASKSTAVQPITNYNVYQVDVRVPNADDFCDYPTMGYDYFAMYVTCVTFSLSSGNLLGNNTFAFNLHNMKAGSLGTWDYWYSINTNISCGTNCLYPAYRLSPAIEDGVPQAEWVAATDAGWGVTNTNLTLCSITNTQAVGTGTLPTYTCAFTALPLAYDDPAGAAQPGTATKVYPGVGFKQISYRAGRLAFAMPIAITCSGNVHDGILWTEVTPQLSTLAAHNPQYSAGIYSNFTEAGYWCYSSADAYMPTLIASAENDLALVYNYSSSSVYPGIVFTGRANTDTPGSMGQGHSAFVVSGANSNGSGRWGDYSACSLLGSTYSRGIVVCGGEYGGPNASASGAGWNTYLYRLRME